MQHMTFDEKRMYNVSPRFQLIFVNMAAIIISNIIYLYAFKPPSFVYGHITLKAPVLVRSPKLSNVELG